MVNPPKIAAIRLPALATGDEYDLVPETTCDSLEFRDLDLSDVDLTDGAITDSQFEAITGLDTCWRRTHLTGSVLEHVTLASFDAVGGSWRSVAVTGSRLGALDLHDGRLESVRFADCKLGYVNLRHATLKNVAFERCRVDELDLLEATLTRVHFADCEVGSVNVHLATLTDVDLRGASLAGITGIEYLKGSTISTDQLLDLAGPLAAALGVEIVDDG